MRTNWRNKREEKTLRGRRGWKERDRGTYRRAKRDREEGRTKGGDVRASAAAAAPEPRVQAQTDPQEPDHKP